MKTRTNPTHLDCATAQDLLLSRIAGGLPAPEALALDAHLAACARCQAAQLHIEQTHRLIEDTMGGRRIRDDFDRRSTARLNERRKALEMGQTTSQALTAVALGLPEDDTSAPPPQGSLDRLAQRFGAAPWWLVSGAFHALLLLLVALIGMAILRSARKDTVILTSLEKKLEPPEEEKPKEREIFKNPVPVEMPQTETVQNPVVLHEEVEIAEHNETVNDAQTNDAYGDEGISDIPLGGSGFSGAIGVGGGGAGAFGRPLGGGRARMARALGGGGSKATESAVDAALEWLARHQEPDGRWDVGKHGGVVGEAGGMSFRKGDPRPQGSYQLSVDAGVTALALLAFLGAGHTERVGKYKDNVQRAVKWIIANQDPKTGALGRNYAEPWHQGFSYHHSMCGLALAEAAAMGRVPETREAAQKAISYTTDVQQREGPDGPSTKLAWRYMPKHEKPKNPTKLADASVSGWYVMQLKSGKVGGLHVDPASFEGALTFFESVEAKDEAAGTYGGGKFRYATGPQKNGQLHPVSPNTTSIGMLCYLYLGKTTETVMGGAEYLLQNLPAFRKNIGQGSVDSNNHFPMYHTYYGTLAMFQVGGQHWQQWNEAMKKMLVPNQRKGGDEDGSWDPIGGNDDQLGGRVYMTAMGALCLEVYYRYLPIYR